MTLVLELLTLDNQVLRSYCFWSAILVVKMLFMSIWTAVQKHKKQSSNNPKVAKAKRMECVERARRAHRNDLENILPFFVIGFIYTLIDPAPVVAVNLFRAVAISRIVHTAVYTVIIRPQPSRGISFFVSLASTVYMTVECIMFFY